MKQVATQELYRIWTALRGARKAPARQDIDPVRLATLLPHVFMLDLSPNLPARIRLAGTHVCAAFDTELKGRMFNGIWRVEDRARVEDLIETLRDEMAVVVLGASDEAMDAAALNAEMVLMPLSETGTQANAVLGAFVARASEGRNHRHTLSQLALDIQRVSWPSGRPILENEHVRVPILAHGQARKLGRFFVYEGGRS